MKNIQEKIDRFFFVSENRKFSALDGLRGYAVFLVFIFHALPTSKIFLDTKTNPDNFTNFVKYLPFIGAGGGHTGVDLFFIISGFLIYYVLNKQDQSIFTFLTNRYKRLLPANTAVLLTNLAVYKPVESILNVLMIQYFFPKITPINFVTWTLSYELLFYLLCAVWIVNAKKYPAIKRTQYFAGFAILIWLTQWFIPTTFINGSFALPEIPRFVAFFFGIGLAKLYFENSNLWKKLEPLLPILGIISIVFVSWWRIQWGQIIDPESLNHKAIYYLLIDLAFVILVAAVLSNKNHFVKSLFNNKWIRMLGVISYSFYLNHAFIGISIGASITKSLMLIGPAAIWVFFIASFLASFAVAAFMFHFLEKPYFLRKSEKELTPVEYSLNKALP